MKGKEPTKTDRDLADYIVTWLEERNGGEFAEMLGQQRVGDRRLMKDELAYILANGGRPPNWIKP